MSFSFIYIRFSKKGEQAESRCKIRPVPPHIKKEEEASPYNRTSNRQVRQPLSSSLSFPSKSQSTSARS